MDEPRCAKQTGASEAYSVGEVKNSASGALQGYPCRVPQVYVIRPFLGVLRRTQLQLPQEAL